MQQIFYKSCNYELTTAYVCDNMNSIPTTQRGDKLINTNKLKACMVEQGYNINKTANALEMSVPTYSRKLNNKRDFTLGEVVRLCKLFNITNPSEIFFAELSQISNKRDR